MSGEGVLKDALDQLTCQKGEVEQQIKELKLKSESFDEPITALQKLLGGNGKPSSKPAPVVFDAMPSRAAMHPDNFPLRRMGRPRGKNYKDRNRRGPWKFPCAHAAEKKCVGGANTQRGLKRHNTVMHAGKIIRDARAGKSDPKEVARPTGRKKPNAAFEEAKTAMRSPQNQRRCVCKDASDSENHVYGMHKAGGGKCMMPNCRCPEFMESQ